jgi:hypothetical protein
LPDYVVYDARSTQSRPRLASDPARLPPAMGYFDRAWQLPASVAGEGGDEQPDDGETQRGEKTPEVLLPLPKAPSAPPVPTVFAAADSTQAGQAARKIAQIVPTFTNYRATIHGASWLVDSNARWSIRDNDRCLAELRALNVPATPVSSPLTTPVPTPVEVTGPVEGVELRMTHLDRTLLMSCEMAARLPEIARVLRAHHVRRADIISSYRDKPYVSFHTMGLALDFGRFVTREGVLDVLHDFEQTPGYETCKAPPPANPRARALLAIVCDLARTKRFSSVLTPNYNAGHRNHVHLDIRPDDPRIFVR